MQDSHRNFLFFSECDARDKMLLTRVHKYFAGGHVYIHLLSGRK